MGLFYLKEYHFKNQTKLAVVLMYLGGFLSTVFICQGIFNISPIPIILVLYIWAGFVLVKRDKYEIAMIALNDGEVAFIMLYDREKEQIKFSFKDIRTQIFPSRIEFFNKSTNELIGIARKVNMILVYRWGELSEAFRKAEGFGAGFR